MKHLQSDVMWHNKIPDERLHTNTFRIVILLCYYYSCGILLLTSYIVQTQPNWDSKNYHMEDAGLALDNLVAVV